MPDGATIGFDTNAIIYCIEQNPLYVPVVQPVFERAISGLLTAHVSVVSLIEVLVKPLREEHGALAGQYRALLTRSFGITMHNLDEQISERAATIRARWNLRVPDAIVAATALWSGATHLVTNDPDLKRVEDLKVLVIDDYV